MKRSALPVLVPLIAMGLAMPVSAQSDAVALEKALYAAGVDAVVAEGWAVCAGIVDGSEDFIDGLEDDGWALERYYLDTPDPYFLDLDASKTIEGMGLADVYAGVEFYPGLDLAYCTYSILDPQSSISISGLDTVFPDGFIEETEEGIFASWRHDMDEYVLLGRLIIDDFELLLQVTLVDDYR